ncbi:MULTISPECIES: DNA methyltransferase [Oceanimonas]|uniref:DNA methyltransferase n=1 Tax=Oceanimonas doudoroffii TaxID=84158 RepID=A0A233RFZ0_9GAMM|nr:MULTISPECIES: DNA methyltransferase [Oceanimonas]NHI01816.1 hypothetical protein [Oceanimonas sp. MB9]OXY82295.1 DNA methyltransferase [Oceanimonas doudoroffii]
MSSTNGQVVPRESYPTPHTVVAALISRLQMRETDHFLEPCRGTDAIWDHIRLPAPQKHWAEIAMGRDYLQTTFTRKMDIIITNPPFSLTEAFIEKSLSELSADGTMAYLQRVNFLGSKRRVPFWKKVGFPDKSPIIIPRPRFVGGNSDSCEYAWFIWDKGNRFGIDKGLSHLICD